jgi:ABC-2 type transport system permease protein
MKKLGATFGVEYMKIRKSGIFWISLVFFIFVISMMGVIMFVQKHPEISDKLGLVGTKATMFKTGEPNWLNYFALIAQVFAGIGMVGFGFLTSWVFGREYAEHTIKDLLALPVSRWYVVVAKFIVIIIWSSVLALVFFVFSLIVGKISGLSGWSLTLVSQFAGKFTVVTLLTVLLCTPVAFFASYSRGYLLPIGFVIVTLITANFTGLVGLAPYFPWSIPGALTIPPGTEGMQLVWSSYLIVGLTVLMGLAGTIAWWQYADQH